MWNGFWCYRYLLWNLVSRDFKLKYRRSVLGVVSVSYTHLDVYKRQILQKSTANCCGGITFHPNEGKEEHYNLNGGRPRQAAEFEAFARALERCV